MRLKAFSVRDIKAATYTAPYFAPSVGEASRQFIRLAKDPQSMVGQFPEDFELFEIGEYDSDSGALFSHEVPKAVMMASAARSH